MLIQRGFARVGQADEVASSPSTCTRCILIMHSEDYRRGGLAGILPVRAVLLEAFVIRIGGGAPVLLMCVCSFCWARGRRPQAPVPAFPGGRSQTRSGRATGTGAV